MSVGDKEPANEARVSRVTQIELFSDLVFVFAVTQLSQTLLHDLSLVGSLHAAILFLAVWWVWTHTSWVANRLDPDSWEVRGALFVLMLAGLFLSTSIPQAFGAKGLAFAGAYVAMHVGRSLFAAWALRQTDPAHRLAFLRMAVWLCASGIIWIGGGFVEDGARLTAWLVALTMDTLGPAFGFRVPGLGRSGPEEWDIEGSHIAERCSQFIIIALGETLIATGTTVAGSDFPNAGVLPFLIAFAGSAALWWIYFDSGAGHGSRKIEETDEPGRFTRILYTYIHVPIVAGIVVSAVGDQILLTHAHDIPGSGQLAATMGGAMSFVLGKLLFKWVARGRLPLSHLIGLSALAAVSGLAILISMSIVAINALVNAILIAIAAWETSVLRAMERP